MADYDPREGIAYAAASRRWAAVAIFMLAVLLLVLLWWFVKAYWGDDGVRLVAILLGLFTLAAGIIGLGAGTFAVTYRLTAGHHDNVLNGLVRFQEADDRGEIARTVAGGVAGVLRSDSQLDRKVLDWAGRLGTGQAQAIIAGQLPDKQQAQQDWYGSVQSAQFEE
jgi:hypothetical protein